VSIAWILVLWASHRTATAVDFRTLALSAHLVALVNWAREGVRASAFGVSGRFWDDENPIWLPLERQIQWAQAQSSLDLAIQAERMR